MAKRKRSKPPAGFLVSAALVVLIALGTAAFFVFREDINYATVQDLLRIFQRSSQDELSDTIPFDAGEANTYALYDGKLCVLAPGRLTLYGTSGAETLSVAMAYETPALCAAGNKIIAYDRGNGGVIVANSSDILINETWEVLTAYGSPRGQFILVVSESGYRGVARLFNAKNQPIFEWRSAKRYITAAGVSPNGSRMTVAAVGQEEESLGTYLTFLKVGATEPLAQIELPGVLTYKVFYPDNNHVCIITDQGVYFYTDDGLPLGEYDYTGRMLLGMHPTSDALFLQLGRYAGGQYSVLVCLGYSGSELGTVSFDMGPLSISAGGKTCAVLADGYLTRYRLGADNKLTSAQGSATEARRLLCGDKGEALLLYTDHAVWDQEDSGNITKLPD